MVDKTDIKLETFLHCLNPVLEDAELLANPSALNIGTVENITWLNRRIKITNNGPRGLLSCRVSLKGCTDGIVVSIDNAGFASKLKSSVEMVTSTGQEKDNINLFPGQSTQLIIEINPTLLKPSQEYKDSVVLTKNTYSFRDGISREIEIPITFYVDYPALSKKKADIPFKVEDVEIYTLRDLAEYFYNAWINSEKIGLPDNAIEWINDGLKETELSKQIGEIFKARIRLSEKYYRFLKLTGVIERQRLIDLVKKQGLQELDYEETCKVKEVENEFQGKIEEEGKRVFRKPSSNENHIWWLATKFAFFFGIGGAISGAIAKSGVHMLIGILIGICIAYLYRYNRAYDAEGQYTKANREGLDHQIQKVEEGIRDRKENFEKDIPGLIKEFSLPLNESIKKSLNWSFLYEVLGDDLAGSRKIHEISYKNRTIKPALRTRRFLPIPLLIIAIILIIVFENKVLSTSYVSKRVEEEGRSTNKSNLILGSWKIDNGVCEYLINGNIFYTSNSGEKTKGKWDIEGDTLTIKFLHPTQRSGKKIYKLSEISSSAYKIIGISRGARTYNAIRINPVRSLQTFSNKLAGKWEGNVGNEHAKLTITVHSNENKIYGYIIYNKIKEYVYVEIRNDGQVVLKGTHYEKLYTGWRSSFSLDTFYGRLSEDGRSISGYFVDTAGNKDNWSVTKYVNTKLNSFDEHTYNSKRINPIKQLPVYTTRNSRIYHNRDCSKISTEDLITFYSSRIADEAGGIPCKYCNPTAVNGKTSRR
jgi:hypothetical protein